jgi:hypothetical protein
VTNSFCTTFHGSETQSLIFKGTYLLYFGTGKYGEKFFKKHNSEDGEGFEGITLRWVLEK